MNNTFEIKSKLRASDFDKYGKILPSAILDLFQTVAGQHASEMGIGFSDMFKRGYFWVLVRVKFQILKMPRMYEDVSVKTWPLAPGRVSFERDYSIKNEAGEVLVLGTSEWAFIGTENRRLVPVRDIYPNIEYVTERSFTDKLLKVKPFEPDNEGYEIHTGFSDIDLNGHVNNTKYANFVLDAIDPSNNDDIDVIQIDYKKELLEGANIKVHLLREEDHIKATGRGDNGETYFNCDIKLKNKQV